MRFLILWLMPLCLSVASPVLASPESLDPHGPPDPKQELPLEGDALTAIFMNKLHRGYYEVGDWDTSDPAFSEDMRSDGSTVHIRDGLTSLGTWKTRENVVCFTYENLNGGCFNIYQRGNCYYAMSAFTHDLVAISVLDGETPDCEPSFA